MCHEGCAGGEAAQVQGAGADVGEEAGRAGGDLRDWGCGPSDESCEALQCVQKEQS